VNFLIATRRISRCRPSGDSNFGLAATQGFRPGLNYTAGTGLIECNVEPAGLAEAGMF